MYDRRSYFLGGRGRRLALLLAGFATAIAIGGIALADDLSTAYIPKGQTSSGSVNPWLSGSVCDHFYPYTWGNNTAYTAYAFSDGSYIDMESVTYSNGYTSPSPPGVTIGYKYWSLYAFDSSGHLIDSHAIPSGHDFYTGSVTWQPWAIGSAVPGYGPYIQARIAGVDSGGSVDIWCGATENLLFEAT